MSRVCLTLIEKDISALKARVGEQKHLGADIIEIRADELANELSTAQLKDLLELKEESRLPLLLTLRSDWEGGAYKGDEEKKSALLEEAIIMGFDYIDLEMKMDEALRDPLINMASEAKTKIIISYHDLFKTPTWSEIFSITKQCADIGGDIAKVALTTRNYEDVLNIIKGAKAAQDLDHKFAIMGMGPFGQYTRILAPYVGCELVYASCDADSKADEGQVDLRTLLELWDALGCE